MKVFSVMGVLLAAIPGAALAQTEPGPIYAGLGYAQLDTGDADLGAVTLVGGWRATRHFGLEAEAAFGVDRADVGVAAGGVGTQRLESAWTLWAVATAPVSDRLDVYARAGYGGATLEVETAGLANDVSHDGWTAGLGARLRIADRTALRLDWSHRDFDDDGLDVLGLSLERAF